MTKLEEKNVLDNTIISIFKDRDQYGKAMLNQGAGLNPSIVWSILKKSRN